MSMRVLVVEDDLLFGVKVERLLYELDKKCVGICPSAAAALALLEKEEVDLALVDVHLKGQVNGIDLAKALTKAGLPVIFMTAFPSDALYLEASKNPDSFFLVKPFDKYTLLSAIDHLGSGTTEQVKTAAPRGVETGAEGVSIGGIFYVREGNKLVQVNATDLYYLEADGNYTTLLADRKRLVIKTSLRRMLEQLEGEAEFLQIHRNYVVNLAWIESIDLKTGYLVVAGQKLPIGRSFRKSLQEALKIL